MSNLHILVAVGAYENFGVNLAGESSWLVMPGRKGE